MSISTQATRRLGIQAPIVLAPMDVVAGGALAAAVSDAGGLGMIGGGYGDSDWLSSQFDAAGETAVGCGFITWSLDGQPALLDLALERGAVAVMLSFGDPAPYAETIKHAGAALVCQVQNREQADRALGVGADVLVAQGTEAGGHGYGPRTTMTLVPELADLVRDGGHDAALLAAGGIADGRGLAAALSLGASGVLMGTRFYAAAEALSTPQARARAVSATGEDTCRTAVYDLVRRYPWPEGHTMNVLDNEFVSRWDGAQAELRDSLDAATTEFKQARADQNYDIVNVTVGQATGLIDSVRPAADIVTGILEEAGTVLRGLGSQA